MAGGEAEDTGCNQLTGGWTTGRSNLHCIIVSSNCSTTLRLKAYCPSSLGIMFTFSVNYTPGHQDVHHEELMVNNVSRWLLADYLESGECRSACHKPQSTLCPWHELWVFRGDPIVWSSSGLWWMLGDTPSTISECSVEILSYDHPRVSGECWGTPPARSLSVPWRSYRMITLRSLVNVGEHPQHDLWVFRGDPIVWSSSGLWWMLGNTPSTISECSVEILSYDHPRVSGECWGTPPARSLSVPWRSYRMITLGSLVNVGGRLQHDLWVFHGDPIVWSSSGLWWMLGDVSSTISECSVEILSYDHPRVSGECRGTSPARSLSVPWRSYRMIILGSLVNVGGRLQHDLWVFRGDPIVWSSSGLWWMLGNTPSTISECSVEILSYDHPRVSGECWGTPPARSLSVPWRSYRMIILGSLVNVGEHPQHDLWVFRGDPIVWSPSGLWWMLGNTPSMISECSVEILSYDHPRVSGECRGTSPARSLSVPWRSYRMIILGSLVNVGEHPQHDLWVFRGDPIVWSSSGLWWMLGNTPSTISECSMEILSYDHPQVSGECWGTSPARSLSVPWRSYRMIILGSLVNVGGHPQHDLWVFRGDPIVWSSSGLWWMLGDTPSTISECSVEILSYDHPRVSGECWGTPPARSLSVPWRSYRIRMIILGSLFKVGEHPDLLPVSFTFLHGLHAEKQ